jgi:hypothetical protein
MTYTSALDVLSLNANPFTIVKAIYQKLDADGNSENIIELAPRLQAALPTSFVGDGSTLRLRVGTRGRRRRYHLDNIHPYILYLHSCIMSCIN